MAASYFLIRPEDFCAAAPLIQWETLLEAYGYHVIDGFGIFGKVNGEIVFCSIPQEKRWVIVPNLQKFMEEIQTLIVPSLLRSHIESCLHYKLIYLDFYEDETSLGLLNAFRTAVNLHPMDAWPSSPIGSLTDMMNFNLRFDPHVRRFRKHGFFETPRTITKDVSTNLEEKENLIEREITEILLGYRFGEVEPITCEEVAQWADQFPYQKDEHRAILLFEVSRLLKGFYSFEQARVDIRSFLSSLEDYWKRKGLSLKNGVRSTNFLDVNQPYGSSQKQMLSLLDEALLEKYDVHLEECGRSKVYVYIDDCLYSGERLINEIDGIIKKESGIDELLIWYPVMHSTGLDHACKKLGPILSDHHISWTFFNRKRIINNQRTPRSTVEGFWPIQKERCEQPEVEKYIEGIRKKDQNPNGFSRIMRQKTVPAAEKVFSSPEAREIVEDLFLTVGVRAINALHAPEKIRPLGFDHLNTLGFGSMFISYRNIANNCPIAFWLQSKDKRFPWTPLIKRKRNREGDIWS